MVPLISRVTFAGVIIINAEIFPSIHNFPKIIIEVFPNFLKKQIRMSHILFL